LHNNVAPSVESVSTFVSANNIQCYLHWCKCQYHQRKFIGALSARCHRHIWAIRLSIRIRINNESEPKSESDSL